MPWSADTICRRRYHKHVFRESLGSPERKKLKIYLSRSKPEVNLLCSGLGSIRPVDDVAKRNMSEKSHEGDGKVRNALVPADVDTEITTDRARGGVDGVGGANDSAATLDNIGSLPHHCDNGT